MKLFRFLSKDARRCSCAQALAALLYCAGTATPFAASIAIDVGHFLEKPGVISARGVSEFEYNRTLALEIAQALERERHRVILIGADGLASDLGRRAPLANGMDLLISVHHDSVQPAFARFSGSEVCMVFTVFAICITVAEAAMGLAIVILLFRIRRTVMADHLDLLKG